MANVWRCVPEFLESWITSESFTCLAAKAALRRDTLQVRSFGVLGDTATTRSLYDELERFVLHQLDDSEDFAALVALFEGPADMDEREFDRVLWQQLDALHRIDRHRYPWAPDCEPDPESPKFGFSLIEHPFFVVGMHPQASRVSRRSGLPALAFNSHRQFARLKAAGTYAGLQSRIRERELRVQNSINPVLADFGDSSEARQYSGQAHANEWKCPFEPAVAERIESESVR